ncbi:MAG: tail fiber domain-containing protein [Acidobacteria bacterium]|nr:tail fiber domain-containing protein [Acidobacteriota bacterium]
MKTPRVFLMLVMLAVLAISWEGSGLAAAADNDGPVANARPSSAEINWQPKLDYAVIVLTVSTPDGEVIRKEFASGVAPFFRNTDEKGHRLADGNYLYELRVVPFIAAAVREALAKARQEGRDEAVARDLRNRGLLAKQEVVQSGAFMISGGAFVMGNDASESQRVGAKKRAAPETDTLAASSEFHSFSNLARPMSAPFLKASPYAVSRSANREISAAANLRAIASHAAVRFFDQVIPDDLIVQGSTCVGLDCVNNESFGFDTIRLKENNTRIKFDDTSASVGFPANDWQLTANDSASGGSSKFSIEDITGATVPFTITAGAATNSLFVDSTGRLGLRTSTPVLDIHAATSNTPAMRLEQNAAGGFTAQTWDIAGNEANFFVRDVTGGARLPFRIRPGAPTSSLDINASGQVGIGTASPSQKLHVFENADVFTFGLVENTSNTTAAAAFLKVKATTSELDMRAHASARIISRFGVTLGGWGEVLQTAGNGLAVGTIGNLPLILGTNSLNRVHILGNGNIGIGGLTTPSSPLQHISGAKLTVAGVWTDASSRALKMNIRNLSSSDALKTLEKLNPVQFEYKAEPGENYVGFIAEDVPELVATSDRKSLSPMDVVAVLTKVLQEQQKTIAALQQKVARLEHHKVKAVHLKTKR